MAVQVAPQTGAVPAGVALREVASWLDRVDTDRDAVLPQTRVEWARDARQVADRVTALAQLLIGEADRAQASLRATGTPTSSWLSVEANLSRRESAGLLHRARELVEHPAVGEAAADGRIGAAQARAITRVLGQLGPQLDPEQQLKAEQVLVGLADGLDADQLARASARVLREVTPERAEEALETKLQREAETAQRQRALRFFRDAGSMRFEGSLPRVEGEAWLCLLDAHAESLRRTAVEERDPLETSLTPEQRRADALIAMIGAHQVAARAPASGGDRPRVMVMLDYDNLQRQAAGAGLIGEDEHLSAGELRRLCCDADLLPVVLGGPSEVLDVGRAQRLVTSAIRGALTLRDRGCAFPGCQTRPAVCEAHHIVPWWAGGSTSLANLVLLCHHHHALVEPARYGVRDQWEVRIAIDGHPEFLPPARQDPARKPLRHQRHSATSPPPKAGSGSRAGPPAAA